MKYIVIILSISGLFAFANSPDVAKAYIEQLYDNEHQEVERFLNSDIEIVGLELLVAEPNDTNTSEKFGHTLLRFIDGDGKWYNDAVLSFSVKIDENGLSYIGTLTNKYPIRVQLKHMDSFWKNYIVKSSRPISRYIIPSTPEQRVRLFENFKSRFLSDEGFGKYGLTTNNCMTILMDLFEASGIASVEDDYIIPKNADQMVYENFMSPYAKMEFSSNKDLHVEVQNLLGISAKDYKAGNNWPSDAADIIETELYKHKNEIDRDIAIKSIIATHNKLPTNVFLDLVVKYQRNNKNGISTYHESDQFRSLPLELYQVCEDLKCAAAKNIIETKYFKNMKSAIVDRAINYFSNLVTLPDNGPQQINYRLHFQTDLKSYNRSVLFESKTSFCSRPTIEFNPQKEIIELKVCQRGDSTSVRKRINNTIATPLKVVGNKVFKDHLYCGSIDSSTNEVLLNDYCQLGYFKNKVSSRYEIGLFSFETENPHEND
tara:strand:- start:1164 stop:2624 length:1461 start_codon:yes stop_codon:yes gene_type:complete